MSEFSEQRSQFNAVMDQAVLTAEQAYVLLREISENARTAFVALSLEVLPEAEEVANLSVAIERVVASSTRRT